MKKEIKLEKRLKREWKNIIFNSIFTILTLLSVIFFFKNIILTTTLVGVIAIIGLIKWKSKLTIIIYIFGAILGAVSEIAVIKYSGAWTYAITNIFDIPVWLFLVWGNASAFIFETSKEIKRLGIKDNLK